jgi:hypothetical protein
MVWWKIKDANGVRGAEATRGLDTPENLYNGDGPVDVITELVDDIIAFVFYEGDPTFQLSRSIACMKVRYKQMYNLILNRQITGPLLTQACSQELLLKTVEAAWLKVNDFYLADWGRTTRPEEREAITNFVIKGRFDERES